MTNNTKICAVITAEHKAKVIDKLYTELMTKFPQKIWNIDSPMFEELEATIYLSYSPTAKALIQKHNVLRMVLSALKDYTHAYNAPNKLVKKITYDATKKETNLEQMIWATVQALGSELAVEVFTRPELQEDLKMFEKLDAEKIFLDHEYDISSIPANSI